MGKGGISGPGIASVAGGSILLWAALKGRKWTEVFRELISGEQPTATQDYPISMEAYGNTGPTGKVNNTVGWGKAKASSFTGLKTASGRAMSADTIASPYLPLGTEVQIEYKGKTVNGTVWDFGPADWVMALDPQRFLDLSTSMMQTLTGKSSNLIHVNYRVTKYGSGRIYRPNSAMTAKLKKEWS